MRQQAELSIATNQLAQARSALDGVRAILFDGTSTEALEQGLYWRVEGMLAAKLCHFEQAQQAFGTSIYILRPINEYELSMTYWRQARAIEEFNAEQAQLVWLKAELIFQRLGVIDSKVLLRLGQ